MKVKIKKLSEAAIIPSYAREGDCAMDLTAISRTYDYTNRCYVFGTGLAIEIPEGYVGLIFPRSSIYKTGLSLSNSVGVIDSSYRGEIKAVMRNNTDRIYNDYSAGDRIMQMIILPFPKIELDEVTQLSDTARGDNGFGSTGK